MKHGVKPSYNQRKVIGQAGLDAREWFVSKDTAKEMTLIFRADEKKVIVLTKEKE